jgi:deoxyadenosine/deoxycytidine kinase
LSESGIVAGDALGGTVPLTQEGTPSPFLKKKYIAVAGNIGVGKSTLVEFLCTTFGIKPVFEPHATNPYLEDFYDDMNRWSFPSQAYFLGRKFRLHLQAQAWPYPVIQDRTIYEDAEVFAKNLYEQGMMDERDFQTYWELYQNIRDALRPPDLLICLKADIKTIRKRIKMRGRKMEQDIPLSYIMQLNDLYERWFESYNLSPTVTIVTNKIDYITDIVDRIDLLRMIERHLG